MVGTLQNFTTTIRTIRRIKDFAKVAKQFEGKQWKSGDQIQIDFQIALIQNKLYLEDELAEQFPDKDILTLQEAQKIASGPHNGYRWKDPAMRGRQSLSPLRKLGICYLDENKILHFTKKGKLLADGEISINQYLEDVLLQYRSTDFNIIPLIATIQLIAKVNKLWEDKGQKPTGLSWLEFSLFVPSLIDHANIASQADLLIKFREEYSSASTQTTKKKVKSKYQKMFADGDVLLNWDNGNATETIKENIKKFKKRFFEYGQGNIALYFRAAGWLAKRGDGYRIDLNPLRAIENEIILGMSAEPVPHADEQAYAEYLSGNKPFEIPWKTKEQLLKIYNSILKIIQQLSSQTNITLQITIKQTEELELLQLYQIEEEIAKAKEEFKRLHTENLIQSSPHLDKIKEIILALNNLPSSDADVELEYQCARGLMALDDGKIKPNYPVGEDGLPTSTALGNQGDIESFYQSFNLLTEVTMLTGVSQWKAENQPVIRHLSAFAEKIPSSQTYCLFIAPSLHEDTIGQFYFQNQRPGQKQQKISPITITQYVGILEVLSQLKEKNPSYNFSHESLKKLLDSIVDSVSNFEDEEDWKNNIQSILDNWKKELLSNS
tara:strand:- start:116 stop:1936 length:1821 start_codon:yes stop_codon:yes gene_type:complete